MQAGVVRVYTVAAHACVTLLLGPGVHRGCASLGSRGGVQ